MHSKKGHPERCPYNLSGILPSEVSVGTAVNDKLSTYTAYDGPWKDGEYTVDEDGNYHNDNEVTIEAKSGDIAVIVNHELGAEGGDELQPGGLWIGQ